MAGAAHAQVPSQIQGPAKRPQPQLAAFPDIAIMSVDVNAGIVKVGNVGTADAVFQQAARLLSFGAMTVPAGGKLSPGQTVDLPLPGVQWNCPLLNATQQRGHINVVWQHALPQPRDAEGYALLLADPDGRIAELNENNNLAALVRPNPYRYTSIGTGKPELGIVRAEITPVPSANGQYLKVTLRNSGSGMAYACGPKFVNSPILAGTEFFHGYIDGSDHYLERNHTTANTIMVERQTGGAPFVMQPGEERETKWFFLQNAAVDQFGVSNGGLQAGCHEAKLVVNPSGHIDESRTCNNETHFFFATGGASCPADRQNYTTTCLQKKIAPGSISGGQFSQ